MTIYRVDERLRNVVEKMRARYPGVRIVGARLNATWDGRRQQCIRFQAPATVLKCFGLLTPSMLEASKTNRRLHRTPIGDGFHLETGGLDAESRPGNVDLSIFTRECPDERERFSVAEAKRLLRRLMERSK